MIHARQHVPAFVDGVTPQTADVESVEALLAVDWIARWGSDDRVSTDGGTRVRPFHRYSLSNGRLLMAEYDGGDYFWVIAYLKSDAPIALPVWTETDTARDRRERWNRGDTSG